MKILKIYLKNLNSLVGEWNIDLEAPAFTHDGLFAITGPTGAGKTTIFDAVCLALYGQTPRLNRISPTENEIMSRGTSDCSAKVIFSTNGKIYRCLWTQRRASGKINGKLQPVSRQLSLLNSSTDIKGTSLAESVSEVASKIEEITHMNFEQFTRSVLLAQGRFDSFLRASLDDRRKILESITGTELYSNISQYIFRRFRDEEKSVNELKSQQDALSVLTPEQEAKLRTDLELASAQVLKITEQHEKARAARTWLSDVKKLENDLVIIKQERAELDLNLAKFEPERVRLADGERAAKLDGAYAGLAAIRKALNDDQAQCREYEAQIPSLELKSKQNLKKHEAAEKALTDARGALDNARPELNRARELDQSILERTRELNEAKNALTRDKKLLAQNQRELAQVTEERSKVTRALEQLDNELEARKSDAGLIKELSGIEQRVQMLENRRKKIEETRKFFRDTQSEVREAQKALSKATAELSKASKKLELIESDRDKKQAELDSKLDGKLLREYRAERDAKQRELVLEQKIQGYEQERARLVSGEPCPLCGAIHHPFVDDDHTRVRIPDPTKTEIAIKKLDNLISDIESLTESVDKLTVSVNKANLIAARCTGDAANAELQVRQSQEKEENIVKDGKRLAEEERAARNALFDTLSPFGISELDESDQSLSDLVSELRERAEEYKKLDDRRQVCVKQENELALKLETLQSVIETIKISNIQPGIAKLDELSAELDTITRERTGLLLVNGQSQSVQVFEQNLQDAVVQSEDLERRARAAAEKSQSEFKEARSKLETLSARVKSQSKDLATSESDFSSRLAELNFENENVFLAAKLDPDKIDNLKSTAAKLEKHKSNLDGRQRDCENRFAKKCSEHPELNPADATLGDRFEQIFNNEEKDLADLNGQKTQLQIQIHDHEAASEKFAAIQGELDIQERELKRWKALSDMIGSADGKKYSSFAQQVTLDLLVAHANVYLGKMSGRYTLNPVGTRNNPNAKDPLALEVLDCEHGGESRPTSNLSGGESFMISLALALGLSQMNGQTTTIESLFLDEGFGSLDEEALDMALSALGTMHQEGRVIGIISHVEALKERIPTRIEVRPLSGGRSEIILPRA